jgi:hypothetical protein
MQNTVTTSVLSNTTAIAATQQPVATGVVQHDTAATAQATANVRLHFEQLAAEREAWEVNAYRTSNEQLYVLLQKCYSTYAAMAGDTPEAAALRSGLKDYINLKGLKFNAGTHTLVKIVKCVFGNDRRRTSAYGIVLRSALAQHISVLDIPAFIRNKGGVEEIRLSKAPNAMTAKQKAVVAAEAVRADNMGVFASTALSSKLDAGNIGKSVVLIGTWQADGSVVVRSVVQNDTAVNAALTSYYSANKAAVQERAKQQDAANDARVAQTAIAAAAASAVVNG